MRFPIHIQSISDLITNSSSEVFICSVDSTNTEALRDEIEELIDTLMKLLGYEDDSYYCGATVEIAESDGVVDGWNDYKYKKGDILIWSNDDNSIPWDIMNILSDLQYNKRFGDRITNVERHHLG